jgi:hypothetical protein
LCFARSSAVKSCNSKVTSKSKKTFTFYKYRRHKPKRKEFRSNSFKSI